jgi:diguanylate cyclase (GGDEF)-like protein/PAS domain S-box-containing protein
VTRQGSVLVVDDSELNRDALSRRLVRQGFLVEVAPGGDDALTLAGSRAFDMVLLDVEMPGMSGLEVLARLRETRSQTELPVIMVTARTQGADIVEAFRLGANDYVTKPIDFQVAVARIRTHLSHKWAVEDLRVSEERYALAARGANDGLWDWNLASNDVHWSPRWKAMLGYEESEIGVSLDEWFTRVHPDDIKRVSDEVSAHLGEGSAHYESEHRIRHRNGLFRWMLCRGAAVRDADGKVTRLAGSLTDITDAKVADVLTGLPNRLLFVDLLDRAIARTQRRQDEQFAILILGLDRFKAVSNSLGPLTADRLLVAVAGRLQAALAVPDSGLQPQPRVTLARLGGDEFTILLEEIVDASDAVRLAESLRSTLQEPFDIDGHQVFTSAAVGITVSTTGYVRPEDVLQDAAIALHRAKGEAATACELFDPAMRERAVGRLQMETDLRNAIDRQEFEVVYQPIIALTTGRISGFEALARWRHPERGLISPIEFIPVAEDTGLIRQLGRIILVESCRRMVDWQARLGPKAPVIMCVNVSSRQLAQLDLADEIEAVMRETGLESSWLKLEITESAFITDVWAAEATLRRMQGLGVEWSLDDFGTGYSSLSYLHRLQADTVKIDRSFVSRMGGDPHGSEMVRAIVGLAHNLGMDVVAEGVESVGQLSQLLAIGCEYAQGFYFSKPVTAVAAEALIHAEPWRLQELCAAAPREALHASPTRQT